MCLDSLAAEEQLCPGVICDLLPLRKLAGVGRRQDALTLKKALPDRMSLFDRGLDEATHGRKAMRVLGGGSND